MISKRNKADSQKENPKRLREAAMFLEELVWLFDSKRSAALRVPELLRYVSELRRKDSAAISGLGDRYVSPNPNKHFLIGVLPRLFQDVKLFPNNEDIADFARTVLDVNVTRYEKRSKYELIGLIVCKTNDLNDERLSELVSALVNIVGNPERLDRVIEARKNERLSWNEVIRTMGSSRE